MKLILILILIGMNFCKVERKCLLLDSTCNLSAYFFQDLILNSRRTNPPQNPSSSPTRFSGARSLKILSSTSVRISWTQATSTSSSNPSFVYNVYSSSTSGTQNFSSPIQTSTTGATEITLTGLTANTNYYFVVRARDSSGNEDSNIEERVALFSGLIRHIPLDSTPLTEKLGGSTVTGNNSPLLNTTDRFGVSNNAYTLNGTNQFFTFSETLPSALPTLDQARTFCTWIRFNSSIGNPFIFSYGGSTNTTSISIYLISPSLIQMQFETTPIYAWGSDIPSTSTWNFICYTYRKASNGIFAILLNSNYSEQTLNVSLTTPNSAVAKLGVSASQTSNYVNGSYSEISIWNRALTQAELALVFKN
jgi:hypothetical protein